MITLHASPGQVDLVTPMFGPQKNPRWTGGDSNGRNGGSTVLGPKGGL